MFWNFSLVRVLLQFRTSSQSNALVRSPLVHTNLQNAFSLFPSCARKKMKLFALPLARKPLVNSTTPLFYLHAQKLASSLKSAPERSAISKLATRGIDKAADTWSGFGSATEGSWKRKIYVCSSFFISHSRLEVFALDRGDEETRRWRETWD